MKRTRRPSDRVPRNPRASMIAALEAAEAHGGTLERRPGGMWTWPGCPATGLKPVWFVPTVTVLGLIARHLAEVTQRDTNGKAISVRIIDRPQEQAAREDARNFGMGFVRKYPNGRLEHIPNSQVLIFTRSNPAED